MPSLYYYTARHYDPHVGRFLAEDPKGFSGDANLYRFVDNNPMSFFDPDGTSPQAAWLYVRPDAGDKDLVLTVEDDGKVAAIAPSKATAN